MKKFSLIIPAYKQEKTIKKDIQNILAVLSQTGMDFEIIPVIDGFVDSSLKEASMINDKRVRPVGYKTNHGKGYAVRFGFAQAKGDVIGFMDAGGELSPRALVPMLAQFEFQGADVVIGSKRHPNSRVIYPMYRRIISWVYQQIIRLLFGINVSDTQVGMKIYTRKLLEDVLPRLLVKRFAFDIEILTVAHHLGYRKMYEAPIELNFIQVLSTMSFPKLFHVSFNVLKDTLAVFYRLYFLHYYDNTNKRKWRYDPELNFRVNIG